MFACAARLLASPQDGRVQGANLQTIISEVLGRIIDVDTLVDADQVDESMSHAQVEEDEAAMMMLHNRMKQNLSSEKIDTKPDEVQTSRADESRTSASSHGGRQTQGGSRVEPPRQREASADFEGGASIRKSRGRTYVTFRWLLERAPGAGG